MKDLKRCILCEIVFREKDEMVKDGLGRNIHIKKTTFNTQSITKPERCTWCEDAEKLVKTMCRCGKKIRNTLERYCKKGNMCDTCLKKIDDSMEYKVALVKTKRLEAIEVLEKKEQEELASCYYIIRDYKRKYEKKSIKK